MLNNNKDNPGKFDAKSDEDVFLGYSSYNKAYRIFNKRTLVVEESIHVTFDEHNSLSRNVMSDDVDEVEQNLEKLGIQPSSNENPQKEKDAQETSSSQQEVNEGLPKELKFVHNYPTEQILGNPSQGVRTCSSLRNICNHLVFLLHIKPKYFSNAENDEF